MTPQQLLNNRIQNGSITSTEAASFLHKFLHDFLQGNILELSKKYFKIISEFFPEICPKHFYRIFFTNFSEEFHRGLSKIFTGNGKRFFPGIFERILLYILFRNTLKYSNEDFRRYWTRHFFKISTRNSS